MLKKMPKNGKLRISHEKITGRKILIISISMISILMIIFMIIRFLDFNTFPQEYVNTF